MKSIRCSAVTALLLCDLLASLLLMMAADHFILTDSFYSRSFSADDSVYIENLLHYRKRLRVWSYLFMTLFSLGRYLLTAGVIYTAFFLHRHELPFGTVLKAVLIAELLFISAALIKFLVFFTGIRQLTFTAWKNYYPLSFLSLSDINDVGIYWLYPLGLLNVFELAYLLLLPYLISRFSGTAYQLSLHHVLAGYIPSLLLLVLMINFLCIYQQWRLDCPYSAVPTGA